MKHDWMGLKDLECLQAVVEPIGAETRSVCKMIHIGNGLLVRWFPLSCSWGAGFQPAETERL